MTKEEKQPFKGISEEIDKLWFSAYFGEDYLVEDTHKKRTSYENNHCRHCGNKLRGSSD